MFATKDMATFKTTLDPNFTMVDDKGKTHDRAEFIKMEVDPIVGAEKVVTTVRVTSVTSKGDMVAVGYDWRYHVYVKGRKGMSQDVGREVGTDTWHKVGTKWLTIKTVIKSSVDKATVR